MTSSSASSSFSLSLTGLKAFTNYYYKAYVKEGSEYRYGEVRRFTTSAPADWLEIPATTGNEDYAGTIYRSNGARNYSFCYSNTRFAPLWTAYTLTRADVLDDQIRASWSYYPAIENQYQVSVGGNNGYPSYYNNKSFSFSDPNNYFARGHQIPDADRKNASDKAQTYYLTNQTPQIQNKFNSGIWSNLETAGRQFVVTDQSNSNYYNASFTTTDVLYIVTGPCYQKNGNETVHVLTANSSSTVPSQVPIPNYYWKAFLKVRKDGSGNVVSAKAIGFWFVHQEYSGDSYTNYVVSVDQIETWTGFDLFANLPNDLEDGTNGAEANSSWIAFRDF